MDTTTWLGALHRRISTRRSTLDRAWAWAYVAQAVALADLLSTPSTVPPPRAGSNPGWPGRWTSSPAPAPAPTPSPCPSSPPPDTDEALRTVLRRLIDAARTVEPEHDHRAGGRVRARGRSRTRGATRLRREHAMTSAGTVAAAPHPTYGELMDAGRRQVNAAHALLIRMPFADVTHAHAAVTRADLLHALGDNARARVES